MGIIPGLNADCQKPSITSILMLIESDILPHGSLHSGLEHIAEHYRHAKEPLIA